MFKYSNKYICLNKKKNYNKIEVHLILEYLLRILDRVGTHATSSEFSI
jgi:hypothetical protein